MKKKKKRKTVLIILGIVIALLAGIAIYVFSTFDIHSVKLKTDELGVVDVSAYHKMLMETDPSGTFSIQQEEPAETQTVQNNPETETEPQKEQPTESQHEETAVSADNHETATDTSEDPYQLNNVLKEIEQEKLAFSEEKEASIINIAFFGIDSTDNQADIGDKNRSDSIIIFSLNPHDNSIKMTHVLRDSKVPIEGHDPQKINAAYKYGSAPLAIKTLNQNFKLNIQDYVTIDFAGLEQLIDIVGGVRIDVTEEEAEQIPDAKAGMQTLNGKQALAYSRIRKIDSDYYRASRQQHVLEALFQKIKAIPKSQYPAMIQEFLEHMETSLGFIDIFKYLHYFDFKNTSMETITIPDRNYEENLWGGIDDTGSWVWVFDIDAATRRIHNFIYGK